MRLVDEVGQEWRAEAKCLGAPLDWFYTPVATGGASSRTGLYPEAEALCRSCPVVAECAEDVAECDNIFGVRGFRAGKTPGERAQARKDAGVPRRTRRAVI